MKKYIITDLVKGNANITADQVLEIGGEGGAEFPEGGVAGNVLEYDAVDGVVWSNRLNIAEDEIDTEIVNRALADGILQNQITANANTRSAVVDKMHHYWDSTLGKWISSGLKFVSGVVNQLEFSGRIKSDGLLINETISSIEPKEIKFKNGNFFASLNDGIERKMLLEGSGGIDFESFVESYFTDDLAYQKANIMATTYSSYNCGFTISQAGHSYGQVVYSGVSKYGVKYSSSGSTIGRFNGNSFTVGNFGGAQTLSCFREFMIETTIPTQRVFVGYSDNWRGPGANPTNVAMSTLAYVVGICMESGNPNILLIHNDNTGSATIIDTGWTHAPKYLYGLFLSQNYGSTNISIKLRRFDQNTGLTEYWTYTITGDYIANNHYLAMWCIDELNASVVKIVDFGGIKTQRRGKA